jgi:hypothetical protein
MTNDELIALRELSIAVLADRLYILGSDQWANPELVARWNAEITPTTILQLTRELAAARALSPVVRDALDMAHSALTYFQVTAICQADTDTATEAIEAIKDALAGEERKDAP